MQRITITIDVEDDVNAYQVADELLLVAEEHFFIEHGYGGGIFKNQDICINNVKDEEKVNDTLHPA